MAKKRKAGPLQKRARRDVQFASQPYLRALKREKQGAKSDYEAADTRVKNIYNALENELQPLGGQYQRQAGRIGEQFNESLGGLTDLLKGVTPLPYMDPAGDQTAMSQPWEGRGFVPVQGEQAAAANAFGTIGATGQMLLSSDRSRQNAYQTSTQRQAAVERATLRRNYLEDYQQLAEDIRNRRLDLKGDWQGQITARMDELRDQRWNRNMQERELEIAEKQFNKTFGLQKKQANQASKAAKQENRQENRKQEFVENEIQREMDAKTRRRLNNQIEELLGTRRGLNQQIETLTPHGWESGSGNEAYLQPLLRKRRRVTKKIKRKKRRVRSLR